MKIIRGETVPWTSVMSIFIMNLINDRTNKQTEKFEHLAWLYKSRKILSPDRGRLDTKEFNMARGTSKIRLYDRDVFPAATEGPANVFSSIPFLLVKSR